MYPRGGLSRKYFNRDADPRPDPRGNTSVYAKQPPPRQNRTQHLSRVKVLFLVEAARAGPERRVLHPIYSRCLAVHVIFYFSRAVATVEMGSSLKCTCRVKSSWLVGFVSRILDILYMVFNRFERMFDFYFTFYFSLVGKVRCIYISSCILCTNRVLYLS